jgi:signal transduction histidine kinase
MARADPTDDIKSSRDSSASANPGKRVGLRAAMIFGFSALLILMIVLASDSIHSLNDLETSSARVRQDYLDRERCLRRIRASLYESGNLLREYTLTDTSSETRESYLAQFHDMRDHADAAMESCLRESSPALQVPLRKLATELQSYWVAADHTMSEGVHKNNQLPLHRAALAQRAVALTITSEVSDVNEIELHLANLEISNLFARSRHRLQNFTALAVGVGLLLAISSIIYISRLENRAQEKYLESIRYQSELKELSKRLVDAQEDERRAISRELHDQIAQSLTAVLINLQDLIDNPQTLDSAGNGLQKIRLLAEDCVNKVRNMALLLRPSMLDDLGLVAALEWQGREVSKRTGLIVEVVDHHFNDTLSEECKTCIYRVVQEALHNCEAHASASRVRVLLEEDSKYCVLSIDDDGVGFHSGRTRGMGLLGMHERVAQLGGTLVVDSTPGRGTVIRVELPLARSRESESHVA